jgi:hypothetical protein
MVKGDGGDSREKLKEQRITAWKKFGEVAENYKIFNRHNIWNRETIMFKRDSRILKKGQYTEGFEMYKTVLIEDENRLELVTKECLDIINLIGSKMDYVTTMEYKDDKEENVWKYIQFGKNEYQADLFFIRNVDRIKLMFNVIKKQKPDYTTKRCMLAKNIMIVKEKLVLEKEETPDIIPVVYEKKKRWKVMKKYIKKHLPENREPDKCKALKWRAKFELKKEGYDMNSVVLARHYEICYSHCEQFQLKAAFKEEYGRIKFFYNFIYEKWYEIEEDKR